MISPVSFTSVAASSNANFSDKIRQPQTYVVKEQPSASSPIKSSKEKGKAGKVIGGLLVASAAVATALGVLSNKGTFTKMLEGAKEGSLKAKVLPHLDKAGKSIADKAVWVKDKAAEFIGKHFNKAEAEEVVEEAAKAAAEAVV